MHRALVFLILSAGLVSLSSCTKKEQAAGPANQAVDLVKRGRAVYNSACIACHNMDPKKDGALGPSVFGSSLELLEARILRAEYPQGYVPKRKSMSMAALPQLKNDIPALHAYLNSDN